MAGDPEQKPKAPRMECSVCGLKKLVTRHILKSFRHPATDRQLFLMVPVRYCIGCDSNTETNETLVARQRRLFIYEKFSDIDHGCPLSKEEAKLWSKLEVHLDLPVVTLTPVKHSCLVPGCRARAVVQFDYDLSDERNSVEYFCAVHYESHREYNQPKFEELLTI